MCRIGSRLNTAPSTAYMVAAYMGAALAMCMTAGRAEASGFALREGAADWMANVFAGNSAKAYDASTAWTNPAGMVRLDRSEFDASASYIGPHTSFSGRNLGAGGVPTQGTTSGNNINAAATAGTFGVWSYSPDLKFGFGATAPFGQRLDYPATWVGRYQSLVSSITDIEIQIAAAYRVNEHLSIGGGPVIDYFKTRLTQAINTGPTAALTGDPIAEAWGEDWSAGFDIGALYQFNERLRVGVNYRSRIQHDIDGSQGVLVPMPLAVLSPVTARALQVLNSRARAQVTLPDNVSLGIYYDVTPRLAVMAELQWTHWSLFNNLTIVPTNGLAPPTVVQESWRNTWFGSVGVSYKLLDTLTLQGGFGYDQSPIPGPQNRYSRIPDTDRYLLGGGVTYAILPNLDLQAAYNHIFMPDGGIDSSERASAGRLVGTVSNHVDTFSLGVRAKF